MAVERRGELRGQAGRVGGDHRLREDRKGQVQKVMLVKVAGCGRRREEGRSEYSSVLGCPTEQALFQEMRTVPGIRSLPLNHVITDYSATGSFFSLPKRQDVRGAAPQDPGPGLAAPRWVSHLVSLILSCHPAVPA